MRNRPQNKTDWNKWLISDLLVYGDDLREQRHTIIISDFPFPRL